MITKHKQTTNYIHWASKIATSANKHADKIIYKTDSTSIEFKKGSPAGELQRKQLSKMMRLRLLNTYIHQLKLHNINRPHVLMINLS